MTIFPDLKNDLLTAAEKSLLTDAAPRVTSLPRGTARSRRTVVTRGLGGRLRRAQGAFVATAAVVVALGVATLAISLGGHRVTGANQPATPATTLKRSPEIRLFLEHFAVLRRPQTAADRAWPAGQGHAPLPGRVIPSLTRLATTIDGQRIFLYVDRASPGSKPRHLPPEPATLFVAQVDRHGEIQSDAVWSPRYTYTITPSPLSSLPRTDGHGGQSVSVSIVPDGITRVRWVLRCSACNGKHTTTIEPPIRGNVAIAATPALPIALRVTWFAANGRAAVVYDRSNPKQRHPEPFPGARP